MADTSALPANWEVNAVFSICLYNHISGNYRYAIGRTRRFHALKTEWGFSKFISKTDLTHPSNGYLIDDKCVFGAEVFVNKNKAVTECLSLKNITISPYRRKLKISNFSKLNYKWTTDEFTAGGYNLKIRVYPNGNGKAT
ncbi:ubiquitin carboxyl-terminal hydrolase 12 [Phtheirospermum japonicum]|uniref:Ubiquitin carboxyl-terminal hydrolase 12 n=1 Tax=Phtheirospermum japonicum TaxID=374723 RepID=A0A830D8Y1_9LAMI|nr:ubiquitin carboxyl-terminal hydrolase 12 [Phtheirospermum japonicum]